jgi:acetyl-CoA carboxylase carboxyltransferase component
MPDDKNPGTSATKRLRQVSSHLNLPADYADVREQIKTLQSIAATPDPSRRGYVRQKQAGKLWVRERLEQVLDAGSFEEIGSLSGTVEWKKTGPMREKPVSFVPSNNVQGMGKLRGRRVLLTADDFSLRSGHADGASAGKTIYLEKLAVALKIPVVKLVDGSSGGGSVTTIRTEGWSYLPYVPMFHHVIQQLNDGIPNVGAILGPAVCVSLHSVTIYGSQLTRADRTWSCPCHFVPFLGDGR